MRALIRGNEIMTEPFSPWVKANLAFLTGTEKDENGNPLPGDGWTLVEDYQEPVEGSEDNGDYVPSALGQSPSGPQPIQTTSIQEKPVEQDAGPLPETVSIGGKEYTLDELKKLIE